MNDRPPEGLRDVPLPNDPPPNDPPPPRIICPTIFMGQSPPPRNWIVKDWVPCGVVTGLYGDGGVGKSLLALQLQTGTALGSTWLGLPVDRVASLGVYCEDDENELWRRQCDINTSYGVDHYALGSMHWMPRLGEDNILMTFARNGVGELTTFHRHVTEASLDLAARLVVIDTAADTFGGSENDRSHVRQFIQRALGQIALKIEGAVVCCAHPSRAGLVSGEGVSGSTGWNNAFRSRTYLSRPDSEDGEPPDHNARILQRQKANYASKNDEILLRWREGVIEPEAPKSSGETPFGKLNARDVFVALLREFTDQKRPVSSISRAGNYAPRDFDRMPSEQRHNFKRADFEKAMNALFKTGKIDNAPYGRKGDERTRIVIRNAGAD